MHTEFEGRVLDIDIEKVTDRLKKFKVNKEGEWLQRRYVYDVKPKQDGKWIRLRTNGKKTTLTIKDIQSKKIDGTKELEVVVSSFEDTAKILEELGYTPKGYQENRRTQYILNGVEIDIDEWPRIPAFLEIEGQSKEEVYETLELLGYSKEELTTLDVESVFLHYGVNLKEIPDLRF